MYLATLDIPQPLNVIVFVVNKKSLFQQTYIYIREGGREEGGGREGRREREREREREIFEVCKSKREMLHHAGNQTRCPNHADILLPSTAKML